MEFPLSRNSLLSISSIVDEARKKEYITAYTESIKWEILQKAYNDASARIGIHNSKTPPYMLKIDLPYTIRKGNYLQFNPTFAHLESLNQSRQPPFNECFPEVLRNLKFLFPDTTFTLDPLQTYLLVDWRPGQN